MNFADIAKRAVRTCCSSAVRRESLGAYWLSRLRVLFLPFLALLPVFPQFIEVRVHQTQAKDTD
jgi:hypothetical protein